MTTAPTRSRWDRRTGVAIAAITTALACAPRSESVGEYEAKIAVKRYNELLPRAYEKGSAGPLAGTATPDEMRRIDDVIGFLSQGGMVMDARQETFSAGPVRVVEGASGAAVARATLVATEEWWYRHVIPSTGEVKQAPRRVRYTNRYSLVRIDGHWLVDRLEETGFEELPVRRRPSQPLGTAPAASP